MPTFSVATWNLFQYAEPGTFWYERDDDNTYSETEWGEKNGFIDTVIPALSADVIGFQEVFSISPLNEKCLRRVIRILPPFRMCARMKTIPWSLRAPSMRLLRDSLS